MEQSGTFTALISGATGLVGEQLLGQLLADPQYKNVVAVVRKPLEATDPKLTQHIIDFEKLPSALSGIQADHGFCCLGTTIKTAGSRERQYVVDHDYVVEFARGCILAGVTRFAVVSSIGANDRSSNFYLRTKGEMERDLKTLPFKGLYIVQPSFLLGQRKEYRAGEKMAVAVMKIVGPFMAGGLKKYRGIEVSAVARCMTDHVLHAGDGVKIINPSVPLSPVC